MSLFTHPSSKSTCRSPAIRVFFFRMQEIPYAFLHDLSSHLGRFHVPVTSRPTPFCSYCLVPYVRLFKLLLTCLECSESLVHFYLSQVLQSLFLLPFFTVSTRKYWSTFLHLTRADSLHAWAACSPIYTHRNYRIC